MEKSQISITRLKEIVSFDSVSGIFTWAMPRPGCRAGDIAGNVNPGGYRRLGIDGKIYLAHRLAWLYAYGVMPTGHIDHLDGNPSNNAISNLRDVSCQLNVQNIKAATKSNKYSKLLGVSYHQRDDLWRARIMVGGKNICIGYFKDKFAAHDAYLAAKRSLHAGCTI